MAKNYNSQNSQKKILNFQFENSGFFFDIFYTKYISQNYDLQ
jgi:hypothetical protein